MNRDQRIASRQIDWFASNARDLPWRRTDPRTGRRDPYHSLVSEAMLQQTQVSRVIDKYAAFIRRFPTVRSLARADEQSVLAAWSGLGYYRRARNLHRAAKMIVEDFAGKVPRDVASLRKLPGVGRYTAGAIASMVFGDAEPLVDGNVQRVLLRVEGRDIIEPDRRREAWVWSRAAQLVRAASQPGPMNEALMELGATVCTPAPATPRCNECPLARLCIAQRMGTQERIPSPSKQPSRSELFHAAIVIRQRGRLLLEQRPNAGLWAQMWQPITIERDDRPPNRNEILRAAGLAQAKRTETFDYLTSHRRIRFDVWEGRPANASPQRGEWVTPARMRKLPIANAHRRIIEQGERGKPP